MVSRSARLHLRDRSRGRGGLWLFVAVLVVVGALLLPAVAGAPLRCDLFAAPFGSDARGDGSFTAPYRSLVKLDGDLAPGQTGCLRGGVYGSVHTLSDLKRDGNPAGRITISAYRGEPVTVVGWISIDASYTTLSHLNIDGSNDFYDAHTPDQTGCRNHVSQSLSIQGHDDVLEYDNYYQSIPRLRGNGIGIGYNGGGDRTVIRYDRIHDVGQCQAYDHLIYLSHGRDVQIYDNWMWDDPHGRGVQLYPAPANARIYGNVIDHAGEGFVIGNEPGDTVSGNRIYDNIVVNATGLPWEGIPGEAIHDYYRGATGSDNSFYDNVAFDDPGGLGYVSAVRTFGNVIRNPHFIDPALHDYETR